MVRTYLEIQRMDKNHKAMLHATSSENRWSTPGYYNNAPQKRPGDCNAYYCKGACPRLNSGQPCPYNHDRTSKGKGKGKGKKGKGKGKKGKDKGKGKGKKGKGKGKWWRSQSENNQSDYGKGKGKDKGKGKSKGKWRSSSEPGVPSTKPRTGTSPSGAPDMRPCNFYYRGKCNNGDKCTLWHPPKCKFEANGNCMLGNRCVFLHNKPTTAAAETNPKAKAKTKTKAKEKGKGKTKGKHQAGAVAEIEEEPLNQEGSLTA